MGLRGPRRQRAACRSPVEKDYGVERLLVRLEDLSSRYDSVLTAAGLWRELEKLAFADQPAVLRIEKAACGECRFGVEPRPTATTVLSFMQCAIAIKRESV